MLKTKTSAKQRRKRVKQLLANAEFMSRYNSREAVNQRRARVVQLSKRRQARHKRRLATLRLNGQFLAQATSIANKWAKDV